ncbi:unnamed protein product [Polarella glacialis]|uniref:Phosphoribosyltransferase domain-containing protein n=1 Tax=Polarella glacialis TaxID=89957 RepID=A0A813LIG4_POLGL|nr:unnamed protein product [Polarella glacialis]CAE8727501.1 unnamed protein product [Polarella glacialis]
MSALKDRILEWKPDVIVAIGGGGFIPARILRTEVKIPILAVSLELYDDATKTANKHVLKKQWFDETSGVGNTVRGRRVLAVDEVDDTRATLEYCIRELQTLHAQRKEWHAATGCHLFCRRRCGGPVELLSVGCSRVRAQYRGA